MSLMQKLLDAGYPRSEMFHHCSDLYVFVTPETEKVVNEYYSQWHIKPDIFKDNLTGKPMYDLAFCYTPTCKEE